jgi:hypothetical protein
MMRPLLTGQAGNIITGLASTVLLAKLLSVEDMGRYSLFFVVVSLAISLGFSWSDTSVVRHGREEYMKRGRINRSFWARSYIFLPVAAAFVLVHPASERMRIHRREHLVPPFSSPYSCQRITQFLEKILGASVYQGSAYVLCRRHFLVSLISWLRNVPRHMQWSSCSWQALISFLVNLRG